jgi:hypothetical protein
MGLNMNFRIAAQVLEDETGEELQSIRGESFRQLMGRASATPNAFRREVVPSDSSHTLSAP